MLEIKLLGSGQVFYNKRPLIGFPRQQPYLLPCYLLLNKGCPHHREHLAAVFWGESPSAEARKSLRNILYRLRQSFQKMEIPFNQYVLTGENVIAFDGSSDHWLDIDILDAAAQSCQDLSSADLSQEQVKALETAVDLYIGDLLESIYEDWVLYDRERLRIAYLNALGKLMFYHGLNGNCDRGLAYGERLLSLDNTRERVHQGMMWLYCLDGLRHAALAQYRRCCQILREELGIPPMAETRRLYERILRDQFDPQRWPVEALSLTPDRERVPDLRGASAGNMLQKLHQLQEMVERTGSELRSLEAMISNILPHSNDSP